ncbi:MAG TPA: hypothetical protein VMW52_03570, partial [Phycisphaerae bacterium]|nr:hypothetical protein [Phycisphaerae bacterium]
MARRRNRTCTADVKLPGSIYRNPPPDGGFYWAVRLPGEPRRRARPLVPAGGRTATKSQPVAIEVARALFERALADADASAAPADATGGLTVAALYRRFLTHARTYYRRSDGEPTSEVGIIRAGCQFLLAAAGTCQAADVGPEHLTAAVDAMIGANLARSTCNKYLDRIQRLFGWAEGPEAGHLVPQATAITVERFPKLSARRSRARETPPVRPVPAAYIERVLDAVDAPVADMIRVQLYTGMRSGELCILRPMDLDTAGKVWLYEPGHHKTAHVGGGERTSRKLVAIGPRAL